MKLLFICWLLLAGHCGMAQGEFTTWRFGAGIPPDSTGLPAGNGWGVTLQFRGRAVVNIPLGYKNWVLNPISSSWWSSGSAASISDAAGNSLFYSIGSVVRDRRGNVMPHGNLYTSDYFVFEASNQGWWYEMFWQSALIAPGPDGLYYVFYWTKAAEVGRLAYALTYCVVDMHRNGGNGDVVRAGIALNRTFKPHMTLVRHRNNRDFWVVARDLDTRGFEAFLLTRQGVGTQPVVSLAGQAAYPGLGILSAAPNGQRLTCGVIPNGQAAGGTGLYDFDNATGIVSNEVVVPCTVPPMRNVPDTQPVAACFSPDSRLLYTIEPNTAAVRSQRRFHDVWQYNLSQPSLAAIVQSRYWVSNVPYVSSLLTSFGGTSMQLAPDSTLWINSLYYDDLIISNLPGQLIVYRPLASAIIRQPNVAGVGCELAPRGHVHLPGYCPTWTMPAVITNMLYAPPALNHEVGCADDSVQFWASSAGLPAGLRWDFGDPGSGPANAGSGSQVAHRYARAGRYPVRLLLADGRVLTQEVTVAAQAVDFTGANVFTPNNDGLNDAFVPVRGALPGGRLRVFSRWGIPVFGTDEAEALRWDGAGAAGGEYLYELTYPDCQGRPRHRRGVLTLVR